jgi:putative copper resistance protein D
MSALANFLNMLLENLLLIAYACAMGGLAWSLLLLRSWGLHAPAENTLTRQSVMLLRWGAMGMAVAQLAKLATHAWLLAETFQRSPFPAYFYTLQCQAGLTRAVLAGGLAAAGSWVARQPMSLLRWSVTGCFAVLLGSSGAWLSHAVGRDEDRAFLMTLTALHQLGMTVWLGGIIQLGVLWRLIRQQPDLKRLWPVLLRRFAWIGGPATLCLVVTGIPLAWAYIDSWQGLTGTDYGAMVLVKVVLLGGTLGFATLNFLAARDNYASASAGCVFQRVPYYVEAETLLLLAILVAAVSLSTQPPAIDMGDHHATWAELYEVFRPKVPRLSSPSYVEAVAAFSRGASMGWNTTAGVGTYWSDYNHNVSGLFLVAIALMGLVSQRGWLWWTRHWPLGFVALSAFIVLRSDAESSWPFGQMGFWEGLLSSDEILLHRLGALIACGLGLIEWRARLNDRRNTPLPYVIPMLCAVGGLLLLGHAHAGFQPKEEFLIQITHNVIGMLAVTMACSRWLELRLTPPTGRLAGVVFMSALLVVGLILLFYRETPAS